MQRFMSRTQSFHREDDGTGTVFGIFAFAMLILIGGIAIDGSNLWRNEQIMQQTADVAAHAGVVQLAQGNDATAARNAAKTLVESNMPSASQGNMIGNESSDIVLLHFDEATNTISSSGTPNAVGVRLQRNGNTGNPVQTVAMRVSRVFASDEVGSFSEWNISVQGFAALAIFQGCSSSDGIYAKDAIQLSSSNTIGAGYCLHSQDEIWMSQQNTFMPSSALSMPNLDTCGSKCTDSANPGSEAAAWERNLIMPDISEHIATTAASMLGTGGSPLIKEAFFYDKPLENSALNALKTLKDPNAKAGNLTKGSVVNLTDAEFEALTDVPEGLVYNISCKNNGNPDSVRVEFGAKKNSKGKDGGEYFTPTEVSNIAIVTNCAFEFLDVTNAKASVMISTRVSSTHTVTAGSDARIGDTHGGCSVGDQTVIMAVSDMSVPADFTGSNVSFVIDGDINLSASSSSSNLNHSGVSFHATGSIKIASSHTFDACANPPAGMIPQMRLIRHISPTTASAQAASTY